MFGYVKPCKGQIGEENFEIFNAYYCGLCKSMGRRCSQVSRLGLSYDVTFLALVLSSVIDDVYTAKNEICIAHPFKKRLCVKGDKALDYSACVGTMLSYLKLADDWHDDKSIKALLGMAAFYSGVRRARRKYRHEYEYIKKCLDELSELEKQSCSEIDMVADCFAKILQKLFTPEFVTDETARRILDWLGYNLGRWIFVLDAVNDMEKDFKRKSYNPFLVGFDGDIEKYRTDKARELEISLTFTLENIASSFELLKIYKHNEVLYRIIYDSLRMKQAAVINKQGEKHGSI